MRIDSRLASVRTIAPTALGLIIGGGKALTEFATALGLMSGLASPLAGFVGTPPPPPTSAAQPLAAPLAVRHGHTDAAVTIPLILPDRSRIEEPGKDPLIITFDGGEGRSPKARSIIKRARTSRHRSSVVVALPTAISLLRVNRSAASRSRSEIIEGAIGAIAR